MTGLDRLKTLEDVLVWCRLHDADVAGVIVQDEYTHDVIVRAPTTYVVFDTT